MHKCSTCQKRFTTKGSLHRHEQNHERTRSYTCSFCGLIFLRRDLLTRHTRIHTNISSSNNTGRARSRQACEACRKSRTSCKGPPPCERCKARDLECLFGAGDQSGRTSRDMRLATLSPPITECPSTDGYRALAGPEQAWITVDDDLSGVDSNLPELPMPQGSFSPFVSSWPWLHEDLFLQSAVSLDFLDVATESSEAQMAGVLNNGPQTGVQHIAESNITTLTQAPNPEGSQEEIVRSVVGLASQWTKSLESSIPQSSFETDLRTLCVDIAKVFYLTEGEDCMSAFITLYEQKFWPLWPLVSRFQLHFRTLHPFLYLAMASIGAMYGGKRAATFGTILHTHLREELIKPVFDYDIADRDMLSLGQARSLTQAAALYFGQRRAFSFAQHIGANLVAQARRTNLFITSPLMPTESNEATIWLDSWIRKENRKRLAFAILRLEMYTSVLHSTRPLVSAEELEIELPCSRYVWHNAFDSITAFAAAVKQELSTEQVRPLFSDVVRIAFDPAENLPHFDTLVQELVFNSVQERVWAACSSRDALERLTGRHTCINMDCGSSLQSFNVVASKPVTPRNKRRQGASLDSHLALSSRTMQTLTSTISNLLSILQKCHDALLSSSAGFNITFPSTDRTSILSCLLIYHLSYLQLLSPLAILHNTCNLHSPTQASSVPGATPARPNERDLSTVRSWCITKGASVARVHAANIYHLVRSEADRPATLSASVNFLTVIGLYHSAVVLWVSERARKAMEKDRQSGRAVTSSETQDGFDSSDEEVIEVGVFPSLEAVPEPSTAAFVTLFYDVNPAWAVRSSFCAALQQLVDAESPFDG